MTGPSIKTSPHPLPQANGRPRPQIRRAGAAIRERLYRPDALVKVTAVVIMASIWRFQDVFPGLSPTKLPLVASTIGLLLLMFGASKQPRLKHLFESPVVTLLALLTVQLTLATVFSLNFERSRSFMSRDFFWSLVTFALIYGSVQGLRDLRWLVAVHVVGAATFCTLVLLRFRGLDNVGRLCCVPYYDANDVSLVLVVVVPFFFYFLRDSALPKVRHRTLAALLPVVPVFQLAGSRGGFIGLAIVILGAMFLYRGINPGKRVWSVVVVMGALFILGGSAYREKVVSIFRPEDDYNFTEEEGRIGMWKSGIALAKQRPLFGFGPRSFPEAYGTFSARAIREGGVPWRADHNAFVELTAEGGFPAGLLFSVMLLTSIAVSWRVRTRALEPRFGSEGQDLAMMAQSNAIGLVGYIVTGFFLSAEYITIVYAMAAFAVALTKLMKDLEKHAAAGPAVRPAARAGRGSAALPRGARRLPARA